MRKLPIFVAVIALAGGVACAFSACEREYARPLLDVNGSFANTPDPSGGFLEILLPPVPMKEMLAEAPQRPVIIWEKNHVPTMRETVQFPVQYVVNGSWTFMSRLDPERSVLTCSNVVFDPEAGFKGNLNITLSDIEGNQLYLAGEFTTAPDFSNSAFLVCEGGTGRFVNSEGWMMSFGQVNPLTGVNLLTVSGQVTEPIEEESPVRRTYYGGLHMGPIIR